MNKIKRGVIISGITFAVCVGNLFAGYKHPLGVNSWQTPWASQDLLKEAGVIRYRDAVKWSEAEPQNLPAGSDAYNWWNAWCGASIAEYTGNAKICYTVTDIPGNWAWDLGPGGTYDKDAFIEEFTIFVIDLLKYSDSIAPGACDMIDMGNEINCWSGEREKEPSWWYADLLKSVYTAVKAYNPNILVMPTAMFIRYGEVEEDFLDALYQLGCKGYMDRINFHMYLRDRFWKNEGDPIDPWEEPWYTGFKNHYPTRIRYMKYVAEQNGDNANLVINSEYGWMMMSTFEQEKSDYYKYVLDISRKSGFCDMTFMYPGNGQGYPVEWDTAALIYSDEYQEATIVIPTTSYYMYKSYDEQYPQWDPAQRESLTYLPAASQDAAITNPGFESGTTGWTGNITLDSSDKHSGSNSARCPMTGSISSNQYTLEPSRLYEIIYWIKVDDGGNNNNYVGGPLKRQYSTQYYPNGWKRVRGMVLTSDSASTGSMTFTGNGSAGTFWVDDVSMKALNLGDPIIPTSNPPSPPTDLTCNGLVNPTDVIDFTPKLAWTFNDLDDKDVQTAYQVIIADNQSDIDSNNGTFWDSGKISLSDPHMTYSQSSPQLQQGTRYYWKVKTWDWQDNAGIYSASTDFLMAQEGGPPTAPTNLLCEGEVNPASVSYTSPDFSWTFNDPDSYDMQSAYRILVADSQSTLDSNNGNMWDSGKIVSTLSSTKYKGSALQPQQTYYWKIMTWDFFDVQGPYSQSGTFTMADDLIIVSGTWWQSYPISPQNSQFSIEFILVPLNNNMNGVTGLSNGPASGYSNMASIIGVQEAGDIVVRNGDTYSADATLSYTAGTMYHVKMDIDIATKKYNVTVTPEGGSAVALATDYDFRTEQSAITMMDNVNVYAQSGSHEIHSITVNGQVAPTIRVTSPDGGEIWGKDSQQTVTWGSFGSVGNVKIDLSTDGGSSWTALVSGTLNDGSQIVTIPDSPSTTCRIRVEELDSDPSDMSDNNFTISGDVPVMSVDKTALDFGEVEVGKTDTLDFDITNAGAGTLTGTITTDKKWIEVAPTSFSLGNAPPDNSITVDVTVDNSILNQNAGQYTGKVNITSNGGDASVEVTLVATCVLPKPNPYDPTKGPLVFFGDGIVPKETTIRIYTLSGELIKTLGEMRSEAESRLSGEIVWDGKNEEGKEVANGIYIYIYESPKEKGVGKFTVIR